MYSRYQISISEVILKLITDANISIYSNSSK
nr:MAG TPA: hypothetical protein [Caudoviricetes sp.]